MSQSPLEAVHVDEAARDYIRGWRQISDFMKLGRSWSGRERNCAYLNTGSGGTGGRFANVSATSGLDFDDDARSIALFDLDHDGDLDFWFANRSGPQLRLMRNDAGAGGFLAVRLRGVTCNRDAIGARVTVGAGDRKWIRTLRAGEGIKTQSTKWLHFGLGDVERIDGLTVRWPGGDIEKIEAPLNSGFYTVAQGGGAATPWQRSVPPPQLTPSRLERPKATAKARVVFGVRLPMPALQWHDGEGQRVDLDRRAGRPMLLNLWASWCVPCRGELTELSEHAEAIKAAGLQVVAVTVDGLDPEHETTPADAAKLLDEIGFPFERGVADTAMLDKLQFFHNQLHARHAPMPVPTSFLVDAEGGLIAVYRGEVRVEQLLKDLALVDADDRTRRDAAAPFAGRWHSDPPPADMAGLAGLFLEYGYLRDAVRYIVRPQTRRMDLAGHSLAPTLTNIGAALGRLRAYDGAAAMYRRAIAVDATDVKARTNLAALLESQGRHEQAVELLQQALQINPEDAYVHHRLGSVLTAMGQAQAAIEHLRRAVAIDDTLADAHNLLGIALAQRNELDDSVTYFGKATQLAPQRFEYRFNYCRVLLAMGKAGEVAKQLIEAARGDAEVWQRYPQMVPAAAGVVLGIASNGSAAEADVSSAITLGELAVAAAPKLELLDALAAAYASAGRFDRAVATAERALTLAPEPLRPPMEARLQQYRQGLPYRAGP